MKNNPGYIIPVHPLFTRKVKTKKKHSGGNWPTPRIFEGWSSPVLNISTHWATSGYCAIRLPTGKSSSRRLWKPCAAAEVTTALGWRPATKNSVKPAWRTIATFTRKSTRSMRQTPGKSWRLNSMPPLAPATLTSPRLPTPLLVR